VSEYQALGMEVGLNDVAHRVPLLRFFGIGDAVVNGDTVTATMPITEDCLNLQRTPHGGSISTLIDYSAAMACGLLTPKRGSTADMQIRFLASTQGTMLHAHSKIVRAGKRLVIVETKVVDDLDVLIAMASVALAPFPNG